MKILIFFLGLFSTSLANEGDTSVDLRSIPLCATLNNVNRTFNNIWEVYNEFKTTGQLWVPVATSACPVTPIDCTVLRPVCAVTDNNFYKTFPNECVLEAEQNATGTVWTIVFNGICSTNPADGFAVSNHAAPVQQTSSNGENNPRDGVAQQNPERIPVSSSQPSAQNQPRKYSYDAASQPASGRYSYVKDSPKSSQISGTYGQGPLPSYDLPSHDVTPSPVGGYYNSPQEKKPSLTYRAPSSGPASYDKVPPQSQPQQDSLQSYTSPLQIPSQAIQPSAAYPSPSPVPSNNGQTSPQVPSEQVPLPQYGKAPEPQPSKTYLDPFRRLSNLNQGSPQSQIQQAPLTSYESAPQVPGYYSSAQDPQPSPTQLEPSPSPGQQAPLPSYGAPPQVPRYYNSIQEPQSSPPYSRPPLPQYQPQQNSYKSPSKEYVYHKPGQQPQPSPTYSVPSPGPVNYNRGVPQPQPEKQPSPPYSAPPLPQYQPQQYSYESPSKESVYHKPDQEPQPSPTYPVPSPGPVNYNRDIPQPQPEQQSSPPYSAPPLPQYQPQQYTYKGPSKVSVYQKPGTEPQLPPTYPVPSPGPVNYNRDVPQPPSEKQSSPPYFAPPLPQYQPQQYSYESPSKESVYHKPGQEPQPSPTYPVPSSGPVNYNRDVPQPQPELLTSYNSPSKPDRYQSPAQESQSPSRYVAPSPGLSYYKQGLLSQQGVPLPPYEPQPPSPQYSQPSSDPIPQPSLPSYAAPVTGYGNSNQEAKSSPTYPTPSTSSSNYNQGPLQQYQPQQSFFDSPPKKYVYHKSNQEPQPSPSSPVSPPEPVNYIQHIRRPPSQPASPQSYVSPSKSVGYHRSGQESQPPQVPEYQSSAKVQKPSPIYPAPYPSPPNYNQGPLQPQASLGSQPSSSQVYENSNSVEGQQTSRAPAENSQDYAQSEQLIPQPYAPTPRRYNSVQEQQPPPTYTAPSSGPANYGQSPSELEPQLQPEPSYAPASCDAALPISSLQRNSVEESSKYGQVLTQSQSEQSQSPLYISLLYGVASSSAVKNYNSAQKSQTSPSYSAQPSPSYYQAAAKDQPEQYSLLTNNSPSDSAASPPIAYHNSEEGAQPLSKYQASANYAQVSPPAEGRPVPKQHNSSQRPQQPPSYRTPSPVSDNYNQGSSQSQAKESDPPSSPSPESSPASNSVQEALPSPLYPAPASNYNQVAPKVQPERDPLPSYDVAPVPVPPRYNSIQESSIPAYYEQSPGQSQSEQVPVPSGTPLSYGSSSPVSSAQYNSVQAPQPSPAYSAPSYIPTKQDEFPSCPSPSPASPDNSLPEPVATPHRNSYGQAPSPSSYNAAPSPAVEYYNSAHEAKPSAAYPETSAILQNQPPQPSVPSYPLSSAQLDESYLLPNQNYNNVEQSDPDPSPCNNTEDSSSLSISPTSDKLNSSLNPEDQNLYPDKSNSLNDAGGSNHNNQDETQTIYNGVVYQGPYYYEPKYKHINYGNFNFLPAPESSATASSPSVIPASPPEPEHLCNPFEQLLQQLQYIVSQNEKSAY